ncbi:uncharacterized protein LOC131328873 [Rhododendron vialii]|uniref:uncharacterized protein LOC131328873 n=1 Tax=Rhododendron vialii TaxID=182163 RepID=UPI00265E9E07|nr:uncharacterized protein LOC131328873 [Rhododendron vialii]
MALRAPLDGGPCMLRSSFGDWEVAAMCFRNDSHRLVYKPSRSFVCKYAETLAIDGRRWDSAVEVVPWPNKMIYASFLYLFQINDETCWFVKNIETDINAEFVRRFAY